MGKLTGLSDDAITVYRRSFEERERRRWTKRERCRLEALTAIRRAVHAVVVSYPAVRRVTLFGSVTRPGAFRPDSDIDVGVEGLDTEAWFDLWRDLERAAPGWTLDVRLLKPDDHFSERVRQRGMVIYG